MQIPSVSLLGFELWSYVHYFVNNLQLWSGNWASTYVGRRAGIQKLIFIILPFVIQINYETV